MLFAAKAITATNRFLFQLTKWAVYVIAGLMLYEVIARYSFEHPTSWAPELATLIFGPFFLLGGPYLLHLGGHVAVDIVSSRATGWLKLVLDIVGMLLVLAFGIILVRYSIDPVLQSYEYNETSYSGWNPIIWPTKAFLPLATALIGLQALAEIILAIGNFRNPPDKPAVTEEAPAIAEPEPEIGDTTIQGGTA